MFEIGDKVRVHNAHSYYKFDTGVVQHVAVRKGVAEQHYLDSGFNSVGKYYDEYNETWVLLDNGIWFKDGELRLADPQWMM